MWSERILEDEVGVCAGRSIAGPLLRLLPRNGRILEAGCGLGAWVVFLHRKGYHVSGIDHDASVISRLRSVDATLDVTVETIEALGHPACSVSAYISLGVVEHFESGPDSALREAYRILEPEGLLFLTVPANNLFRKLIAHPLRSLYLLLHRMKGGRTYFAEYRYSRRELRLMVEHAGFEVCEEGLDDFASSSGSLSLWSEFPFLRGSDGPYALNGAGRLLARLLNSVSPSILASGIYVAARKPGKVIQGQENP